jgi:beta-glucanase (GH16 family)
VQNTAYSNYALNATCYRGGNVALRSGMAVLSVTRTASATACKTPAGSFATPYTGADISTWGTFSQATGRFEVRMKYPSYAAAGYQGGFWMNPQSSAYGAWPASGEIDVNEWFSQYPDRVYPNLHYTGSTLKDMGMCAVANPDVWHTYAVEWSRTRMGWR